MIVSRRMSVLQNSHLIDAAFAIEVLKSLETRIVLIQCSSLSHHPSMLDDSEILKQGQVVLYHDNMLYLVTTRLIGLHSM